MIPENMVEYAPETQYKLVKVMFGKDDCNKKYLGKISSDMQFKKRCCAWRV